MHSLHSVVRSNFSIFIDWQTPFSLLLTPTDTDTEGDVITYCVSVYTHSTQELLDAECGLMETHYTYTHQGPGDPSPCDLVDICVFPVNTVGNGSRNCLTEAFYNGR